MALIPVTLPAIPAVPNLPGVPALGRGIGTVLGGAAKIEALAADVAKLFGITATQKWGIFSQQGKPLLIGDAVRGIGMRREYAIADYPVEAGSFSSYNKVQVPYDARVVISKGGSDSDRAAFIRTLEQMIASLTLYTVVTPEFIYSNANLVHYDFDRRAESGATMLTVSIGLREVRVSATSAFTSTNTQSSSGASPQNGGTVQPADPTAGQSAAAAATATT